MSLLAPFLSRDGVTLYLGDCRDVMAGMEPESIDAIVTDPPYGLSFMGREWDHGVPGEAFWREALRVAKPGAHLLAFGGTRTFHRLTCAIEDAGWEIRDCLGWIYGSGFPKSLDVSKAIDKAAGNWRGASPDYRNGPNTNPATKGEGKFSGYPNTGKCAMDHGPQTAAAKKWAGWGTSLKPAYEPVILARKPLSGTVAGNVLAHGTGALNIEACRVGTEDGDDRSRPPRSQNAIYGNGAGTNRTQSEHNPSGRWPANLIHDGSPEVLEVFPVTTSKPHAGAQLSGSGTHEGWKRPAHLKDFPKWAPYDDRGSAARFFYCAKASRAERGEGNTHPTVKPLALMRYLCRLVTPPGGIVLDPFAGSGTTLLAAMQEGFRAIGIEKDAESCAIIASRLPRAVLPLTGTE